MTKRANTLPASLLSPYISYLVVAQRGEWTSGDIVCRAIRRFLADQDTIAITADGLGGSAPKSQVSTTKMVLSYELYKTPAWGGIDLDHTNTDHKDRENHLVVVLELGPLIAIHSTDGRVKDHLRVKQAKMELGGVGLLRREALEEALLSGAIETFYMGEGAPSQGRRGPRSKTTYGVRLEDTLDVIEDQRHSLSGARATAGEDLLGEGNEGVVGANLTASSFWYHRSRNWSDFVLTSDAMLGAINAVLDSGGGHERFVIFARYIDDIDAIDTAYDLGFTPPSFASLGAPSDEEVDSYDWMQTHIASVEPSGKRTVRVKIVDTAGVLSTVTIRPERKSRRILLNTTRHDGDIALAAEFIANFSRLDPNIYYESGHTVSRAGIIAEHFNNIPFGGWSFADLSQQKIDKEKTGDGRWPDIRTHGGDDADTSLFGWVIRSHKVGWLYCDDGADELCDFVYLNPDDDVMEIWHVKACAATAGRQIAAVPYEEVCAQVVKNVESLHPQRLAEELDLRLKAGAFGPTWFDGVEGADPSGLRDELRRPRASLQRKVMILQPHVTQYHLANAREASANGLHDDGQRLRRLDHLLLATSDAVARVGAQLTVVTATSP